VSSEPLPRPDVQKVLEDLKDFQRDTVNYVFRRLYTDTNPVSRFLIADEVGLGKTLVARGVIASVVDHLWDDVERIDVVYICSNQEIAQQNLDRLNIANERTFQHASRATLLPIKIQKLKENKLNFISLTPGTSFNLNSQTGKDWERIVLYNLLRKSWHVSEASLSNILRGDVRPDRWKTKLEEFKRTEKIDHELEKAFIEALQQQPDLRQLYENLSNEIDPRRKNLNKSMRINRNSFIRELRRLLAKSSLAALEPDLIILDEFQRFKYLLDEDNEFALLAQELFNYRDASDRQAKVLLLSATPYKMYTLQGEVGENHYEDFMRTIKFLLNSHRNDEIDHLETAISQFRRAFLGWNLDPDCHQEMHIAKKQIETILRKVMVRTERLAVSQNRNGMLTESCFAQDQLHPSDLTNYVHLDRIAKQLGVEDQVEYWKSSAYPFNLMEGYKLKHKLQDAYGKARENGLFELLQSAKSSLLVWDGIQKYERIEPANARLRALINLTLESGNWQLLWLPPALPYYRLEGPFAKITDQGYTKTLIFSAWRVVPKVVAVMLSYEAERRMVIQGKNDFGYEELTKKHKGLLRFAISKERKSGMSVFSLIYPCVTLAKEIDPLAIAKKSENSSLSSSSLMLEEIKLQLQPLLWQVTSSIDIDESGPIDETWYWIAPLLLDRYSNRQIVEEWLNSSDPKLSWSSMLKPGSDEDEESGFSDHIKEFAMFLTSINRLGRQPKDLLDVMAQIALASPAVTVLRSIMRVTRSNEASPAFLAAAAQAGLGFRTLFNQADTITLLQSITNQQSNEEKVYWRSILLYNTQGNLQAVLDEYIHVLNESLGLKNHSPEESALKLGFVIRQAVSIRSPSLRFDEIKLQGSDKSIVSDEHRIRCRYAMRFGDEKNDTDDKGTRDTDVRIAFNSPFRPFVLTTTSIGQEGLDFHQYCHRVVHWNLPSNPVDLEQREGRVHRYKGHVVRRNLAEHYELKPVVLESHQLIDAWEQLFEYARKARLKCDNDLIPYWVYEEGKHKIERMVPVLPLSREISRLEQLKKSLVTYRSVIGQPRQQELLEALSSQQIIDELQINNGDLLINLSPPSEDISPE